MTEELNLHLLEFTRAEREVAGSNLVAEAFSHLTDAEWQLHSTAVDDVLEVDEDSLSRLRAQKGCVVVSSQRSDDGFHHQVELARLCQPAASVLAHTLAGFLRTWGAGNMVLAKTALAGMAVDHHVMKQIIVTTALPDLRMHDN